MGIFGIIVFTIFVFWIIFTGINRLWELHDERQRRLWEQSNKEPS